jgi:hypothetical protein
LNSFAFATTVAFALDVAEAIFRGDTVVLLFRETLRTDRLDQWVERPDETAAYERLEPI